MKTNEELAVIRAMCDRDLLFFSRFFYKELRGTKFIVNDHHKIICNELRKVENYELELLNINIPPRHSKTELAGVNLIARGIGINPKANYLYISASDELRSETSVRIRDIITHEYFTKMYGVELKKDQNAKNLWRTDQGGGLKTATIFGQITGFGAGQMNQETAELIRDFEGCVVIDDANKTDDSEAENVNNEKVSRVFFNTIISRRNSKDTPIINIQQRAGLSDLTAQLEEHYKGKEKTSFLTMPVIKDGIPLWEWKMGVEEIEVLRTSYKTAHVFQTQYMQNPEPSENVVFKRSNIHSFKLSELNQDLRESVLGAIDVADKGVDYLSFPLGKLIGEKVYITDWIFTQENMEYSIPRCSSLLRDNKADHCAIETNNHGIHFFHKVADSITETNLIPVNQTANKHSRIINQAEFIRLHFVFRSDYEEGSDYDKAMQSLFRYTKDGKYKKDDAPDSLALLSLLCRDYFQDRF